MRLAVPGETLWWELAMANEEQPAILVVDEEPQILQLVRLILSRNGWRVLCARNVRQATRLCRRSPGQIALVLVDAVTAEAEGSDWPDRLRAGASDSPIVVMAPVAPDETCSRFGFLAKPFTPELLLSTVRRALGRNVQAAGC